MDTYKNEASHLDLVIISAAAKAELRQLQLDADDEKLPNTVAALKSLIMQGTHGDVVVGDLTVKFVGKCQEYIVYSANGLEFRHNLQYISRFVSPPAADVPTQLQLVAESMYADNTTCVSGGDFVIFTMNIDPEPFRPVWHAFGLWKAILSDVNALAS